MISPRFGLLCLLCAGCFQPAGKPDGESSDSGASSAAAETGMTTATPTVTSEASSGVTTGATDGAPTTGMLMTASGPMTEPGETTATTGSGGTTVDPSGSTTMVEAVCGDGMVQTGEECDDGNMIDGDGCPSDCKDTCGDGVVDAGEKCDDGNEADGDGCSGACVRDALYVFVTKELFESTLGGLDGADKVCQEAALAAGLDGKYRAWLSDDFMPAIARVSGSKMPYVRRDGKLVAPNIGAIVAMLDQKLKLPINMTEMKEELLMLSECGGQDGVWTGTGELGTAMLGANCGNWADKNSMMNATGGSLQMTDARWTQGCGLSCMGAARLYCFELES